jgi:hypothetical protein
MLGPEIKWSAIDHLITADHSITGPESQWPFGSPTRYGMPFELWSTK